MGKLQIKTMIPILVLVVPSLFLLEAGHWKIMELVGDWPW